MDDRFNAVHEKRVIQPRQVRKVAEDKAVGGHSGAMAKAQVVVDPNVVTAGQEELHGMAANVARAAGNQNSHG